MAFAAASLEALGGCQLRRDHLSVLVAQPDLILSSLRKAPGGEALAKRFASDPLSALLGGAAGGALVRLQRPFWEFAQPAHRAAHLVSASLSQDGSCADAEVRMSPAAEVGRWSDEADVSRAYISRISNNTISHEELTSLGRLTDRKLIAKYKRTGQLLARVTASRRFQRSLEAVRRKRRASRADSDASDPRFFCVRRSLTY